MTVSLSDFDLVAQQMVVISVTLSDQRDAQTIWYSVVAVGSPTASTWAIESAQWQTYWQRLMAQQSDPGDYTDAANTTLATLATSTFTSIVPTLTVTTTHALCPIIGDSTIVSDTLIIC